MRTATTCHLISASLVLFVSCMTTDLAAEELSNPGLTQRDSRKHWVCDYTRGRDDALMLRCDDVVGLLNDHLLFDDGPQDKSTQFIPIWSRPTNPDAAINLVRILLCKQEPDCSVEMSPTWASNI